MNIDIQIYIALVGFAARRRLPREQRRIAFSISAAAFQSPTPAIAPGAVKTSWKKYHIYIEYVIYIIYIILYNIIY